MIWFYTFIIMIAILIVELILLAFLSTNTYSNLALNLATEFLGILFVITGVSWILKKREDAIWSESIALITKRITIFNNKYLTFVRDIFDIHIPLPFHKKPTEENILEFEEELVNITDEQVLPNIKNNILVLSTDKWKKLYEYIIELKTDLILILTLFGNKIDPETHHDLILIYLTLEELITSYSTIPELFTFPPPPTHIIESITLKESFADKLEESMSIAILRNRILLNKLRTISLIEKLKKLLDRKE